MQHATSLKLSLACLLLLVAGLVNQPPPTSALQTRLTANLKPRPRQLDSQLIQVRTNHTYSGGLELEVFAPVYGDRMQSTVEHVTVQAGWAWLKEDGVDVVKLTIHGLHRTRDFPTVTVSGRRQDHRVQWQQLTPQGPSLVTMARWDTNIADRNQVLRRIQQMLVDTDWGRNPQDGFALYTDSRAGFWCRANEMGTLPLARRLQIAFQGELGTVGVLLAQGSGTDYQDQPPAQLPMWRQTLRSCQWQTEAWLKQRQELIAHGLVVDLGLRSLEFTTDP